MEVGQATRCLSLRIDSVLRDLCGGPGWGDAWAPCEQSVSTWSAERCPLLLRSLPEPFPSQLISCSWSSRPACAAKHHCNTPWCSQSATQSLRLNWIWKVWRLGSCRGCCSLRCWERKRLLRSECLGVLPHQTKYRASCTYFSESEFDPCSSTAGFLRASPPRDENGAHPLRSD